MGGLSRFLPTDARLCIGNLAGHGLLVMSGLLSLFRCGRLDHTQPGRAPMPPLTMKQCARPNGFTAPNGQHAAVPRAQCAPLRERQGQAHEQTRPRAHP